jgi:hypothetical protein
LPEALLLYDLVISRGPHDSRHIATQAGHEQAEKRKAERFDGRLEVQEKENPINERDEQAPEEPPKAPVVGEHEESDLPAQAADEANGQQYVAQHNHFGFLQ